MPDFWAVWGPVLWLRQVDIFSRTPLISHFASSRRAGFRSVPSCLMTHSQFSRLLAASSCLHNSHHASGRIWVCALLTLDSLAVILTAVIIHVAGSQVPRHPVFHDCSRHASCRIQVCALLPHAHSQSSRLFTSSSCSSSSQHTSCRTQVCALLPHYHSQSSRLLSSPSCLHNSHR